MNIRDKLKIIIKKYYGIKSLDTNDCGPACLASILGYYGYKTSIARISDIALTDINGTTIMGLIYAANAYHLSAKGVKVRGDFGEKNDNVFEKLEKVKVPFIAHLRFDSGIQHFVVIYEINKNDLVVFDPSKGFKKYTHKHFLDIWTGKIILFDKMMNFKKGKDDKQTFLNTILKRQIIGVFKVAFISLIISLFGIASSLYYKYLIDMIIPRSDYSLLFKLSIGTITIIILKLLFEYFRNVLITILAQKIDSEILMGYFKHIVMLHMLFFDSKEVGSIVSRFQDSVKIRVAISSATVTLLVDGIMCVVGGILLHYINSKMFFLCFIPMLIYVLLGVLFFPGINRNNKDVMEQNSHLNSRLVEMIEGIHNIKAFNAENRAIEHMQNNLSKYMKTVWKSEMTYNLLSFFKKATKELFNIGILAVGGYYAIYEGVSIGNIISFTTLAIYYLDPFERILNLQSTIQTAFIAADRLGQVMELNPEDAFAKEIRFSNYAIEFSDVTFRYGYRKIVLKNFNLSINEKESIAIVGTSGEGKTTIAKLLMRFYEIESGEITIGGIDIRTVSPIELRKRISYVAQDTYFFSGTIRDNLKMWNTEIDDEFMIDLCKKVKIHDDIMMLSKGYDDIMAAKGANFSGGQIQRLALVRALLACPRILILDEATSNLDSISEKEINNLLYEITSTITVIKIAHRLSTVVNCDKIVVIKNGMVSEIGKHDELLFKHGDYYELWKSQYMD